MSGGYDEAVPPIEAGPQRAGAGPATVARVLAAAAARLGAAGVEGAARDARLLLAAALEAGPELPTAHRERVLDGTERARIERLIARRAAREPVSRILGRRGFWSLDFKITPDTLDPRPDSETLIEAVLGRIDEPTTPRHILDLGTGCGCLLLALLSELPGARGLGVDISEAALGVARKNADSLGFGARTRFERRDWAAGLSGPWQVIISNPPYIKEREIEGLAPEVAHHDPKTALDAGPDGLDAYRALLPQAARLLDRGGTLALEVGKGQQDAVEALLVAAGLSPLGWVRDLGGIERCLVATQEKPWISAKK
jgi:release factor glutamine methyltransferase